VFLQGASPEVRLLLLCSRTRVEPCTAQSIRVLLRETIDWKQLQRIAWQHGVTPLVYAALNSVASDAVPVSVLDDFRDQVRAATGRAAVQTKELLRLLALFEAAGVPAICFKGPVLAASVYGNVAFRVFSDLIFLSSKTSFRRFAEYWLNKVMFVMKPVLRPARWTHSGIFSISITLYAVEIRSLWNRIGKCNEKLLYLR
jgi:hypothetical protein